MAASASEQLADFIRAWIDDHDSSALALAQRARMTHTTLSALFNHGTVPRPTTLKRLAVAMGLPVSELLHRAGHISKDDIENPVHATDLARLYEFGDLTDEELQEVKEFARFVRSKRSAPSS